MGHTHAKVKVYNHDMPGFREVELLVDTGSTYTWISEDVLGDLEIKPRRVRTFRAIDGRLLKRDVCEAVAKCMGEQATTVVVFARKGDVEILGVHALEGLGLEVDPTTKQLRKTEAVLAV